MRSYKDLNETQLVDVLYEKVKTLKNYKISRDKSSQSRFECPLGSSRAKVTTLNARMERNAEMYESIKMDLREIISLL